MRSYSLTRQLLTDLPPPPFFCCACWLICGLYAQRQQKKMYCVYIHMYIRLFSREKGCVSLFSVTSDSISMVWSFFFAVCACFVNIYICYILWLDSKKNGCRGRIYFCCGVSLLFLYRTSTVDLYLILLDYGGCSDGSHRTHIPIPRNPTHKTQGKLTINSVHNDKCLPSLVHSSVLTSTEMNLRGRLPRHKIKS